MAACMDTVAMKSTRVENTSASMMRVAATVSGSQEVSSTEPIATSLQAPAFTTTTTVAQSTTPGASYSTPVTTATIFPTLTTTGYPSVGTNTSTAIYPTQPSAGYSAVGTSRTPSTSAVQNVTYSVVQNSNYPINAPTTVQATYPITTSIYSSGSLVAPQDTAIQNAINQGRIYSPTGAVYVPNAVALRSGMHTIYDSKVPTFEAPLSFQNTLTTSMTGPMITARRGTEATRATEKSKFIVRQTKRSACC